MQRRAVTLAAAALLLLALMPVASVSAASTIYVHPGESIQAALNRAPAGSLISVERGTYRGNLEIKRSVRLLGHDAILVPAAKPTFNLCLTPGAFNGVAGICIHGAVKADMSGIETPVSNVSIEGITVRNFSGPGIVALGVASFRVARVVTAHNGEMGMFINMVSNLSLLYSTSYDNHGDGVFLENLPEGSPSANAVITGNRLYDNLGSGIMFLNSLGGRIASNDLHGNCAGIVVAAEGEAAGAPTSGDVSIQLNQVTANDRLCPPDGSGAPLYGGIGIVLIGAQNTVVALNDVRDNLAQTGSTITGGGIVLLDGALFHAGALSGNSVRLNWLSGNTPNDIYGDGTGTTNTIGGNSCTITNLKGAC
jgi:parallel beta-helix repeat protein